MIENSKLFLTLFNDVDVRKLAATGDKHVVLTTGDYTEEVLLAAVSARLCNVVVIDEKAAEKLVRDAGR